MAQLIDTSVLVYRFDPRDPERQKIATEVLRDGLKDDRLLLPHQALIEFVAATIRPRPDLDGKPLLESEQALAEAESLARQFEVLYPDESVLVTALRGMAAYRLSWFDAHLWAYAEAHGIPEILSEDFEHGRHYGKVRVVNPFRSAHDQIRELPPLYG
ncbi:MAG: PIN domain-containing protein [Wenzhouxiangellaceae bacterium]